MHESQIRARVQDIYDELSSKDVSAARVKELGAEMDRLGVAHRTHQKATSMASYASPNEHNGSFNPGGFSDGTNPAGSEIAYRGLAPGMENRIDPVSMYSIDKTQIKALQQAAQQGTPFKVQFGRKGIEHGNFGGQIRAKAAVTEGGLTPNLLPPIQQLGDRGWFSLPYELTRVVKLLAKYRFRQSRHRLL